MRHALQYSASCGIGKPIGLATDAQGGPTPRNVGMTGGLPPVADLPNLPTSLGREARSGNTRGLPLCQVANLPAPFSA